MVVVQSRSCSHRDNSVYDRTGPELSANIDRFWTVISTTTDNNAAETPPTYTETVDKSHGGYENRVVVLTHRTDPTF